jgi:hypothetical protein
MGVVAVEPCAPSRDRHSFRNASLRTPWSGDRIAMLKSGKYPIGFWNYGDIDMLPGR